MFSWLVVLTLMAAIAVYLLFPRTDLVDLKDKPMDDVDAKRLVIVHQAALNLANTKCSELDGAPLYTAVAGAVVNVKCNGKKYSVGSLQLPKDTVRKFLPEFDKDRMPNIFEDTPEIKVELVCLDAQEPLSGGEEVKYSQCDSDAHPNLAAFLVTYAQMDTTKNKYATTRPMLPYMLGEAFNFKYTGKVAEINGVETSLRLNTYCGHVESYRANQLPPEFRSGSGRYRNYKQVPFIPQGIGATKAISNTRYQIVTLPHALTKTFNTGDWVACITPLNDFDGARLTIRLD
ncbi:MAG: hypothetical protein ILP11_03525 [Alphaproteobacteria bacterium]|nr:hypothetical protein [Alphaproteobacteria bacterium]